MESSVKITLIIAVAVVVIALFGFSMFYDSSSSNTVQADGYATIEVMPDLVTINFNIETRADNATSAKDENAQISDDLITALVKKGFERKQITTQYYNVYPEYNWQSGSRSLIGYKATHQIKLEMSTDDSDEIGEIIDAGVEAGATISYINFELSTELQNQYKTQALEKAAQDAQIKAQSTANGLNKQLGKLISVTTSNFNYYPWSIYAADSADTFRSQEAKSASTSIQPGEQEVSASVSVIYKIF